MQPEASANCNKNTTPNEYSSNGRNVPDDLSDNETDKRKTREKTKAESKAQEKLFHEFLLFLRARELIRRERMRKKRKVQKKNDFREDENKSREKIRGQQSYIQSVNEPSSRESGTSREGYSEKNIPRSVPEALQPSARTPPQETNVKKDDEWGRFFGTFFKRRSRDESNSEDLQNESSSYGSSKKSSMSTLSALSAHKIDKEVKNDEDNVKRGKYEVQTKSGRKASGFLTKLVFCEQSSVNREVPDKMERLSCKGGKKASGFLTKPVLCEQYSANIEVPDVIERLPLELGNISNMTREDSLERSSESTEEKCNKRSYFFKTLRSNRKKEGSKTDDQKGKCAGIVKGSGIECSSCGNECAMEDGISAAESLQKQPEGLGHHQGLQENKNKPEEHPWRGQYPPEFPHKESLKSRIALFTSKINRAKEKKRQENQKEGQKSSLGKQIPEESQILSEYNVARKHVSQWKEEDKIQEGKEKEKKRIHRREQKLKELDDFMNEDDGRKWEDLNRENERERRSRRRQKHRKKEKEFYGFAGHEKCLQMIPEEPKKRGKEDATSSGGTENESRERGRSANSRAKHVKNCHQNTLNRRRSISPLTDSSEEEYEKMRRKELKEEKYKRHLEKKRRGREEQDDTIDEKKDTQDESIVF